MNSRMLSYPVLISKYIVDPEYHMWFGVVFFVMGISGAIWLIVLAEIGSKELLPREKARGYAIRLIVTSLFLGLGLHFLLLSENFSL